MEINPIEFGRLCQSVDDLKREMTVHNKRQEWRVDNLETRVEVLERSEAREEVPMKMLHKALWVLLGGGVMYLLPHVAALVH